jgi:heterodisulfide reductase subunit A-like polyferredoxin
VTPAPEVVDELPPEEDQRVDDAMNAIATPLLIADEMDDEEIKEFAESTDAMILEAEGLLTERTIIKFDKHAKKAQLYEVAVAACAREHKDPLWRKLETVYKMERILKAKLRKKYNGPATRKVKEYLARAKKSKSGVLSKIASKVMGVFHKK